MTLSLMKYESDVCVVHPHSQCPIRHQHLELALLPVPIDPVPHFGTHPAMIDLCDRVALVFVDLILYLFRPFLRQTVNQSPIGLVNPASFARTLELISISKSPSFSSSSISITS